MSLQTANHCSLESKTAVILIDGWGEGNAPLGSTRPFLRRAVQATWCFATEFYALFFCYEKTDFRFTLFGKHQLNVELKPAPAVFRRHILYLEGPGTKLFIGKTFRKKSRIAASF